jgi:hypothetical protein
MICLFILSRPVAALDDDLYALAHNPAYGHRGWNFIAIFLFIGWNAVVLSRSALGPLVGITSVLWLMMRNDSAISPRISWM